MPRRRCPVCMAETPRLLFQQCFETFAEEGLLDGYKIVSCQKCGGIYADEIPSQEHFDAYYDKLSKYERHGGNLSKIDIERFKDIVEKLMPYALGSVADIGCATGGLLNEFKAQGVSDLHGFDQSASCINLALKRSIPATRLSAMKIGECGRHFDLITCTSVLEHIRDVENLMPQFRTILNSSGHFYLEVPDVARYKDTHGAGFALFSTEHLNYFSESSVRYMLARYGFAVDWILSIDRQLSEKSIEPTLGVLCHPSDLVAEHVRDFSTIADVMAYIEKSQKAESRLCKETLTKLAHEGTMLILWGAGTQAQRLLATTPLGQCFIIGIVDSNERYQGLTLHGHKIESPEALRRAPGDAFVLISSEIWQDEIEAKLREIDETRGIIKLYP